jgi:DnaJ-domain-containing protein 1
MDVSSAEFRALLRHASLSQAAFANLCDISATAVSYWCHNRRPIPGWVGLLIVAAQQIDLARLSVPCLPWHEVLGVPEDCDHATLRRAFWSLAKQHHPDTGGNEALMQRINDAYDAARFRDTA